MLALVQHGAKVDKTDKFADPPLHQACFRRRKGLEATVDTLLRWGADETAFNHAGQSPTEMLDVFEEECPNPAPQDEIERTRLLLAWAPADRAWRRRGWLVMLRSRAAETRTAMIAATAAARSVVLDRTSAVLTERKRKKLHGVQEGHRREAEGWQCGRSRGHVLEGCGRVAGEPGDGRRVFRTVSRGFPVTCEEGGSMLSARGCGKRALCQALAFRVFPQE